MTRVEFEKARIEDKDGLWLCLKVASSSIPAARRYVFGQKEGRFDAELKTHREKRSLDANAYLWVLLDELADALMTTKEELYLQAVREVGVYKDFTLAPEDVKTFRAAWEKLGTGWPTEQVDYTPDGERLVIRAYYGSSQYNTKQMSRLIDFVVEECQALGIETMSPVKLEILKDEWKG